MKKIKYLFLTNWDIINFVFFRISYYFKIKKLSEQKTKPIWLFSERGQDAKDNAFFFYKYVRERYFEIDAYYIIDFDSADRNKLKGDENVVNYKSKKHKELFLLSDVLVSAYFRGSIEPWRQRIFKFLYKDYFGKKYIFVQHGITKDDMSDILSKEKENYNLFICGAKPEYKYLSETLGYNDSEIVYTGFARYDSLHDFQTKSQILLMSTWRRYIVDTLERVSIKNKKAFMQSRYFEMYNSLLNNNKLNEILKNNNLELIFFQHTEFQKYNYYFESKLDNIKIANKDDYDVQTLLKESKLLITDYSSVFFDFAYMQKPMIYYQFDEEEFFAKHHKKGYFDYRRDGFGDVVTQESELIKSIENIVNNNFEMKGKYKKRIDGFFPLHDRKNRERIYNEIIKL